MYCSQASSGQKEMLKVLKSELMDEGNKARRDIQNSHQERQCKAVIGKLVPGVKSKEQGKATRGEARSQGPEGKGSESDCRVQVGTRQTIQN